MEKTSTEEIERELVRLGFKNGSLSCDCYKEGPCEVGEGLFGWPGGCVRNEEREGAVVVVTLEDGKEDEAV